MTTCRTASASISTATPGSNSLRISFMVNPPRVRRGFLRSRLRGPSLMAMTRRPNLKMRLSCVTTITARPGCTAICVSSSMTAWPEWASRAAVGSSQTSSRGSWISARAMATRMLLAARQLRRQRVQPRPHAELREQLRGAGDGVLARPAGDQQRHRGVLRGGQRRQQLYC